MTQIKLAKTAGFCFGVDRGVNLVYDLIQQGKKVCTLGPIIHNPQLVADLSTKGVRIIEQPEQAFQDETIVIRSHGVGQSVYHSLKKYQLTYNDATCPFVAKIHKIVFQESSNGNPILIAGNPEHPEVQGIQGHCVGESFVFQTPEELEDLLKNTEKFVKKAPAMVAQTTFQVSLWEKCVEIAKNLCTNLKIFDTICNATSLRQAEAIELAKQSDLMVVIGGRHSSNTKKLLQVCLQYTNAVLIETKDELDPSLIMSAQRVGITAGASTPAYIIKEVLETMSEIIKDQPTEELSFAELLEQSEAQAERLYTGKRIKGIVTSIAKNEVQVDIGGKQSGFIPSSELSDDPNAKPEEIVAKGDEIDLVVLKVNDQDGIVTLSKKRLDAEKGFDEIIAAKDEDKTLSGVITDVVRGGALVLTNGVKIFIPISQLSDHRVENAEEFLKKEVEFKVIEVNPNRRRAVASVRAVLNAAKKAKAEAFWSEVEVGKTYTGTVKSLTDYGAFVDLGGVDGMIHITELSWTKIKHPSDVVKVGDTVEVYVKDIDEEKKKISLGYRKTEDNPWEIFKNNYAVDQVVNVTIVSLTQFGAFAEIIPGVDGLIHISQIANQHIAKVADVLSVGQKVDAKITEIDLDKKRISLSMRALLEEEAPAETEETDEVDSEKEELKEAVANIEGVEIQ